MDQSMDLMEKLFRAIALLHRYRRLLHKEQGPMADPHRGQGRVLTLLKMQQEIGQRELAYLLDMRPQSLGELLSKLELRGYIIRTPSASDRRVLKVRLTAEGEAEALRLADERRDSTWLDPLITDEDRKTLEELMDRMITRLEEMLKERGVEAPLGRGHWHDRAEPFGPFGVWEEHTPCERG